MHKKIVTVGFLSLFAIIFFAAAGSVPKTAFACTNPASIPTGFTAGCPTFDAEPTTATQTGSVTATVTPAAGQYVNQQFYLYNGAAWTPYQFQGSFAHGYATGTVTYTIGSSQLLSLPSGTIYLAEWDWTWNMAQSCFTGPGSSVCGQGSWRLQAFDLSGSSSGGPPPITYSARTDSCETGSEAGCAGLGLSFLGRNTTTPDGVYHPLDVAPNIGGLYGMNNCIIDPDFHEKICRMTDYSLASANRGLVFNEGDSGDNNIWDANDSAILIDNNGGTWNLFSFDPSTMTTAITGIGGQTAGGSATQFAGSVTFSSITPDVLYELDTGRTVNGAPYNELNRLTINRTASPSGWTLNRTPMFNFSGDNGNCLPSNFYPNWVGSLELSSDEQSFTFSFGDHGQNGVRDATHPYGATLVANYTIGKGCRVMNTYGTNGVGPMTIWGDWGGVGPVTNGAGMPVGVSGGAPLIDTFYLHEATPAPNGAYSLVGGSLIISGTPSSTFACYGITVNGLCENYTWEVATTNVRPNHGTGHGAKGNLYEYFGQRFSAYSYHDPWTKLANLLSVPIPTDLHGSYNNADASDDEPLLVATTHVCGQASGSAGREACDPQYTGAMYDEIDGTSNQVTHPGSTPLYRFAHTFNTGTNWSFATQNAIGSISPSGKFFAFSSDWNMTLGCTNGASSGCLDNIASTVSSTCASGSLRTLACQRGDIFVVQLQ